MGDLTLSDVQNELQGTASVLKVLERDGKVTFITTEGDMAELRSQLMNSQAVQLKLDRELQEMRLGYEEKLRQLNSAHEKEKESILLTNSSRNSTSTEESMIDRLAPGGVYRASQSEPGDLSSNDHPFRIQQNNKSRLERGFVSQSMGSLTRSNRRDSSGTRKQSEDGGSFGRNRDYGPPPPKMAVYDGKIEWQPFKVQFERIAKRYGWAEEQKLERLIESLRDKALKFYCTCPTLVQDSYSRLISKLDSRLAKKDLPNTIRRKLQDMKQDEKSLEEFAEVIQEMVSEGYPDAPESVMDMIASDTFLKGVDNKRAALSAMDKDPVNLGSALQMVKSAVHNQRLILGTKRPEVRKVRFQENTDLFSDEEYPGYEEKHTVRAMQVPSRMDKIEADVESLKTDIKDVNNKLSQVLSLMSSRSASPSLGRGRSPSPSVGSTSRDFRC